MLSMPAKATMQSMPVIHAELRQSMIHENSMTIDISTVVEVDLSLVQLIQTARKQVDATGGTVRISAPANGSVTALLRRAGFLTDPSPDDIDFWFHGVLPQ